MNTFSQCVYRFNDFEFDSERFTLRHRDELVRDAEHKSLQVLAVLLENPNELVLHDEIIDVVWRDNPHGVTPMHVNQYVSKLRKLLGRYEPELKFVENVRGRGYIFRGNVEIASRDRQPQKDALSEEPQVPSQTSEPLAVVTELPQPAILSLSKAKSPPKKKYLFAIGALALVMLASFGVWKFYPRDEEEEVRRVVRDSQLYESLVLYKNPAMFREESLDKYWVSDSDATLNYDRSRIRDLIAGLIKDERHYGDETKCEQFEFQSVEIDKSNQTAIVKTLEKWFVAVYFNDGTLQKNKYIGPYFVSYILRKTDGRWLIEKSSTARVNRPIPRLADIEAVSEIKPGAQFLVKITGQDLEAETVYLEVIGEGCPENRPCKVPNSALRENAKLSETVLDQVPLTLASGTFQITAHNGDSPPSNPVYLTIP